jgi:hypothetical protein
MKAVPLSFTQARIHIFKRGALSCNSSRETVNRYRKKLSYPIYFLSYNIEIVLLIWESYYQRIISFYVAETS